MCGTRATSIPSQRVCVTDRENLRHLASVRVTCMLIAISRTLHLVCVTKECIALTLLIAMACRPN